MKFIAIKRLWLRRLLMATIGPLFVVQYVYLGLRAMVAEFAFCWNFEHPIDINGDTNA